jgi:hypothetical protein
MRTIAHYAHVNEKRVFEKWKSFEYGGQVQQLQVYATGAQPESEKHDLNRESSLPKEKQGKNEDRL